MITQSRGPFCSRISFALLTITTFAVLGALIASVYPKTAAEAHESVRVARQPEPECLTYMTITSSMPNVFCYDYVDPDFGRVQKCFVNPSGSLPWGAPLSCYAEGAFSVRFEIETDGAASTDGMELVAFLSKRRVFC